MRLNRATLIALATVAISSTAFAQAVQEAASNYEVPTYDYMSLDVHGTDLFNYSKAAGADDASMSFHLGSDFRMDHQDPMSRYYVNNDLDISGSKAGEADLAWTVGETLTGGYHMWLMGSRGVHVGADLEVGLGMQGGGGADETAKQIAFAAEISAGYGRVIDARVIAVAAAMYEAVGKTASAADLAKAAEIMGQAASGAYLAKHKDPTAAAAAYYADLGAAVGTDNPFKLAEVENSPIYNIGSRSAGYHFDVMFDVDSGDHGADESGQSMSVGQSAGYAMLLADNMGLSIEEEFHYGLGEQEANLASDTTGVDGFGSHPGDGNMSIWVDVDFNIDHSSQWNTTAHVDLNIFMPKEGDMSMDWALDVNTNYAMGTQAVAYAGLNVHGGNDASMYGGEIGYGFEVGFRYFIF